MQPKVFIVGDGYDYGRMFVNAGWFVTQDLSEANMLQFTGGEDVSPILYGEEQHRFTGNNLRRDLFEIGYYGYAQRLNIPCAGICRGGQFLNVMSGGRMYQHVVGHATGRNHLVVDVNSGKQIVCSSTHHQMMRPSSQGVVLGVADLGGLKWSMEGGKETKLEVDEEDTEVVYYPHTRSLCFQPHPEFFDKEHECFQYYFDCIELAHDLRA